MTSPRHALICGVNWLGDAIMSMPAIQAFRAMHPATRLALLTKPPLQPLWTLQAAVDELRVLRETTADTFRCAMALRRDGFDCVYVLPNSFRSALVPWLAGIPIRTGRRGHGRTALLNDRRDRRDASTGAHQQWEYADLLGVGNTPAGLPAPNLTIAASDADRCLRNLGLSGTGLRIGLFPGAARGPSKRWPEARFVETGRRLREDTGAQIPVFGTSAEADLCARVAAGIGKGALSMAGRTTLTELAAVLSRCHVVVANDSGGMHLAAAVGAAVVAVFGLTDPRRTGPLGPRCRVIQPEGVTGCRDIARQSRAAMDVLNAIPVASVYAAVLACLEGSSDRT